MVTACPFDCNGAFLYFELECFMIECFNRSEWSCGLLLLVLVLIDGDDWSIQCGILVNVDPHWFEGSVSVLCYLR
jgi:hypothetical protein